jgi:hypothetical protein
MASSLNAVVSPQESLILKVTSVTGHVTVFVKLKDLYPECEFLIQGAVQLFPLRCLADDGCHRNQNCMEVLAKRTKYVFDTFPDADLLILYFRYQDRPTSQRGGVFWRDMRSPRYFTLNKSGWEKFKKVGKIYSWRIPDAVFLNSSICKS